MKKDIRKVSTVGYSKIITLPKDWIKETRSVILKQVFIKELGTEVLCVIPLNKEYYCANWFSFIAKCFKK